MKICDQEGCDKEANVHITKVVDGGIKKVHLCKDCAALLGVDMQQPESMADFFHNKVEGASDAGVSATSLRSSITSTCSFCGMDRPRLKKNMRLGCKHCYEIFTEDLAPVIKSMHHSRQHMGKVPPSEGKRARITRELAVLHEQLSTAVLQEQFEDAAMLRDKIRTLEADLAS